MKKTASLLSTMVVLIIIFSSSCSKSTNHNPVNVQLLKMQVDSVKSFINGNWKVVKTTGGFAPTTTYPTNYYYEFLNNSSKIVSTKDGNTIINDTLIWAKDFISGDSINIMRYHELNQIPAAEITLQIINDTFIFRDDGADATFFYLIKK